MAKCLPFLGSEKFRVIHKNVESFTFLLLLQIFPHTHRCFVLSAQKTKHQMSKTVSSNAFFAMK